MIIRFPYYNNIMLTDNVGVTMKYPSFEDMERVSDEELQTIVGVMKLVTNCIDSIYDEESVHKGSEQTEEELTEFVDSLNSDQFQKMADWFENMPSISHTIAYDCITCKAHNEQELRGLQSFFT